MKIQVTRLKDHKTVTIDREGLYIAFTIPLEEEVIVDKGEEG